MKLRILILLAVLTISGWRVSAQTNNCCLIKPNSTQTTGAITTVVHPAGPTREAHIIQPLLRPRL